MLVEREVIFADDLVQVFGPRPWTSRTDEIIEAQKKVDAAEALANPIFPELVAVKNDEPAVGEIPETAEPSKPSEPLKPSEPSEPETPERTESKTKA